MSTLYPWFQTNWQALIGRHADGNLPHALLITGKAGLGKRELALHFAQSLLCRNPMGDAWQSCGHCHSCQLFAADNHPDFLALEPVEEGKTIPIDTVRQAAAFLGLTSQYGGHQILLVNPAEALNRNSANSLLKTLEEPTRDSVILLLSSQPSRLLPTIRSRCQKILLTEPSTLQASDWLAQALLDRGIEINLATQQQLLVMADNAPLRALDYAVQGMHLQFAEVLQDFTELAGAHANPIEVAERWSSLNPLQVCLWLTTWVSGAIRLKSAAPTADNPQQGVLRDLSARTDIKGLFMMLDRLKEALRALEGQANKQLVVEDLLAVWWRLNGGRA